jgi:hypothetical protein
MRREYGLALRESFQRCLRERLPRFEALGIKNNYVSAGERIFRWKMREPLHAWVVVVPHDKREAFTVELAWSRLARFPELSMRPCPDPSPTHDECAVRLAELAGHGDRWWSLDDERRPGSLEEQLDLLRASLEPVAADVAAARVQRRVDEAVLLLESHGLPYLDRVLEHHQTPPS